MKKKLLITGFDPFGGERVNPAFEAVRLLPDEIAGLELCKLEIPTEFIKSGVILKDALRAVHPNAVLCVGQAGGRTAVTPERVAINLMDARIPDNAGYQPIDTPVVPDGPAAFFPRCPSRQLQPGYKATVCPLRYPIPLVHTCATAFCIRCCIQRRSNIPACAAAFSMCLMPRSSFPANRSAPSPCPCPISLAP